MGFQRYHCYNLPILADMDSYLALDASLGIESAAIMWGCKPHPSPVHVICHVTLISCTMQP